jgi:hypothetical protein
MNKSQALAMARLEAANPFRGADAPSKWTRADEDALLALLLADARNSSYESSTHALGSSYSAAGNRIRRLKRPVLAAAAAVVVGAVGLAVFLSSGTTGAFAAWTATTTIPPASQLATADSSCRDFYASSLKVLPEVSVPPSLPPVVLTDSRGPFEMLIYGTSASGICLWDSGVILAGDSNGATLPPANDQSIGVPGVGFVQNDGSPATYAYGHVGTQVTAVTLILENGVRVEATVQSGLYGAWWPSEAGVSSADVTTSGVVVHQDFGSIGPSSH